MEGVGGLEGWHWISLLEGMATVVLGVAAFFMLPDGPRLRLSSSLKKEIP